MNIRTITLMNTLIKLNLKNKIKTIFILTIKIKFKIFRVHKPLILIINKIQWIIILKIIKIHLLNIFIKIKIILQISKKT